MNTMQLAGAIAVLATWPSDPLAGQAPKAKQALVVEVENLSDAARRPSDRSSGPALLRPTDVVRYRLTFTNLTADSVRRVQFTDPVPSGLTYLGGTATADREDVEIGFSIDGGRTYSKEPVIEEVIAGRTVRRSAPAAMYTHVRWTVAGWIQPAASVSAAFEARMPAATGSAGN